MTAPSFDDFYRQSRAGLVRVAYLIVGSQAVAEELVQEAFVRLHERFATVENPGGYVRVVLVRLCVRTNERRAMETMLLERTAPRVQPEPEPDAMWDAVQRLRPERRAVLVLRYYEDLPHDEIARHSGLPGRDRPHACAPRARGPAQGVDAMSDQEHLEDDVRRSLRAKAEGIVVDDQDFDPTHTNLVDGPDIDPVRAWSRSRLLVVAAVVAVVLVAAGVIALQSGHSNDDAHPAEQPPSASTIAPTTTNTVLPEPSQPSQPAPAALVEHVTSVPWSVLTRVGVGSNTDASKPLPGPVLTDPRGRPHIIWVGAEYCPYCAAERWPLIQALSHFGTFSGLRTVGSAAVTPDGAPEVHPNTQSFSFHGSTYTSDYVSFESVEEETNTFKPLDTPTPALQHLVDTYSAPPYVEDAGAIPFVDFANTYLLSGVSYDAGVLQGHSRDDIAAALSDPTNPIAPGRRRHRQRDHRDDLPPHRRQARGGVHRAGHRGDGEDAPAPALSSEPVASRPCDVKFLRSVPSCCSARSSTPTVPGSASSSRRRASTPTSTA